MNALAAWILAAALVFATAVAAYQSDRALDLWYCHASAGYGHQQQLDECLESR